LLLKAGVRIGLPAIARTVSTGRHSHCSKFTINRQRLQDLHGIAGYREKWVEHDFPTTRLLELHAPLETSAKWGDA
jgi:hypothetical protein